MAEQYLPVLILFIIAAGLVGVMVSIGGILGPHRPSAVKQQAFECGNPPTGTAWGRFPIKFYMTAISFIVFDVEVVFFYPWAVAFRQLGWSGFAAMMIFASLLALGLVYEWRKGAFEWD